MDDSRVTRSVPMNIRLGRLGLAVWVGLILGGCVHSPAPLPGVNLAEPGWRKWQGQALWITPRNAPLPGELFLALHPSGQGFLQFTKPPLAIITARQHPPRWEVISNLEGKSRRGQTPANNAWIVLLSAWDGQLPPSPWEWRQSVPARWLLTNTATGESLHGFLQPVAPSP